MNISWDDYFLSMAYVAAARSPDFHTKCGAVIVDEENRIVSVGYNGPVRGLDDEKVSWERPAKHLWVIHAEINALAAANLDRNSSYKIYTTGHPCLNCMQTCVQNGINTFIFEVGQRIHSLDGQEENFMNFFKAAGSVWEKNESCIPCSSYSYGKRVRVMGNSIPSRVLNIIPMNGTYQALSRAYNKVQDSYLRGLS